MKLPPVHHQREPCRRWRTVTGQSGSFAEPNEAGLWREGRRLPRDRALSKRPEDGEMPDLHTSVASTSKT